MQPAREGSPRRKINVWGTRPQFLPQPGFLLYRMQHAQGRSSGAGFSAHALPPGAPDVGRTRRPSSRPERPRRKQAPPQLANHIVEARQRGPKARTGQVENVPSVPVASNLMFFHFVFVAE